MGNFGSYSNILILAANSDCKQAFKINSNGANTVLMFEVVMCFFAQLIRAGTCRRYSADVIVCIAALLGNVTRIFVKLCEFADE